MEGFAFASCRLPLVRSRRCSRFCSCSEIQEPLNAEATTGALAEPKPVLQIKQLFSLVGAGAIRTRNRCAQCACATQAALRPERPIAAADRSDIGRSR